MKLSNSAESNVKESCFPHVLQLFAGFQTLLKILEASNTNITVVNKRFTTNDGPIPTTVDVFVSYPTHSSGCSFTNVAYILCI